MSMSSFAFACLIKIYASHYRPSIISLGRAKFDSLVKLHKNYWRILLSMLQ